MTFEQAVAHVRAAHTASVAAFAFVPTVRRGETVGGAMYTVMFDDAPVADAERGDDPVIVAYLAGIFGSGEGALEFFTPDDVPDEALDVAYDPTTTFDADSLEFDVEIALAVLRGSTLDAAIEAFDAADPPRGPNATPEAVLADLLLARGMPATLPGPDGMLPAVIVLLDEGDPRLGMLVDAFGGAVVVETAPVDDQGDADSDVEVGAGGAEDGPEPDATDGATDDADSGDRAEDDLAEDDRVDDALAEDTLAEDDLDDDDFAEAAWVGIGRGAALATLLATRALPEWADDLPTDLADAWRALLAFVTAAVTAPPDAQGRRPKAVYQELRRLAAKIDRLVARQFADHEQLLRVVAGVVAREMDAGTFVDDDLALPARDQLDAPVPLPGSRWTKPDEQSDDVASPPIDRTAPPAG